MLERILQLFVSGLLQGSLYAIMACGLSLIFGVAGVPDFSYGILVILGAYIAYWIFTVFAINAYLAIVVATVLMAFVALVLHKLYFRKLETSVQLNQLIVTFAVALVLENLIIYTWTADFRAIYLPISSYEMFGAMVPTTRLMVLLASATTAVAAYVFLKATYLGKAIRAVSQDKEAATLMGINSSSIFMLTYVVGIGIAGEGGGLLATIMPFSPGYYTLFLIKSFCIVVLGGAGSIIGTYIGGIMLGLAESLSNLLLPPVWMEGVSLFVFLIVLVLRPSGLFRGKLI